MGRPVDFPGSNRLLRAPQGTEGFVQDMYVFNNGTVSVSCWELSRNDMLECLQRMISGGPEETLKLYIAVFSGGSQPPIYVGSEDQVREVITDFGSVWKR